MQNHANPREVFKQAIGLANNGEIEKAVSLCKRTLEKSPKDVNINGLLGAFLLKLNRAEEAEHHLRLTTELAPSFAKPFEDLGVLLLRQGRFEESANTLQNAVRLDPSLESAHFNLGKALAKLGKGKEADAAFEASFALSPIKKLLAEAAEYHKQGKLEESEALYRKALNDDPGNIDATRMLGLIAAAAGQTDEAKFLLQQVIERAPDFFIAHIDLGNILKDQDHYEEAIACFQRAIAIEPRNPHAQFLLASTLSPAAFTDEALDAYQACLDILPEHPGALLGIGHMLKTVGRQEEGIAAYRKCIDIKPGNGETYWSLANLKTFRFTDEEIAKMEDQVASGKVDNEGSEANFLFALAKAHEDAKDHKKAWDYYQRGNKLQRSLVKYDPVSTEVVNNDLVEAFTKELMDEKRGLGCQDKAPIFILGLPRSGSTLLEQIIASHSMVEGTSELPYISRITQSLNRNRADGLSYPGAIRELGTVALEALGEEYLQLSQMHRKEGAPRFIDKMPNNFPSAGFINLILPKAKIIDARRNPLDACFGNFRQLYAKGQPFTYDLTDIGEYYLQYQRMMDHWNTVMPGQILHVQYEDTVMDLESQVRRILEFLELPWEDACLNYHETDRAVRTASSEQVRQPIYTGAINHWRKYEQHLDELLEVLEPVRPLYQQYEKINA